jgi:hypothetical protein
MTSTTATTAPLLCPLCAETMSPLGRFGAVRRACCGQMLCQPCLYRHVLSVFEEGVTGSGRMQLLCPMGCARPLCDKEIRDCLSRQNYHAVWLFLGSTVFYMMQTGIYFLGWNHRHQDPLQTSIYYDAWLYLGRTRAELQDMRRYEQWSLAVALRSMVKNSNKSSNNGGSEEIIVQHCPAPDCDYLWLVANPAYRRFKQVHEAKKTYLWFSPPKPEPSGDCNWVQPEYLNMGHGGGGDFSLLDDDSGSEKQRDGRHMVCGKCHTRFCGLCRQPWTYGRRKCHGSMSCRDYGRTIPTNDAEFGFVAQGFGARMCPGCSLRISRIDGCNHMTCPCGVEWCYVCERTWNPLHYGCVDRPRGDAGGGGGGGRCTIS